jgi:hypothetical protein
LKIAQDLSVVIRDMHLTAQGQHFPTFVLEIELKLEQAIRYMAASGVATAAEGQQNTQTTTQFDAGKHVAMLAKFCAAGPAAGAAKHAETGASSSSRPNKRAYIED